MWENRGQIIGVVKNFHSRSLHNEIVPVCITLNQTWRPNYVFVRLNPENISQVLNEVEEIWKNFSPHFPFAYQFLDEVFEEQYRTDQRTGTIFKYFAILAVFISCLGIL